MRVIPAIAAILPAAATAVTAGQWVSFADETAARLTLSPFVDNIPGDPMIDGQEKDVAVGDLDRDGLDDVVVVRKQPFSTAGARQDVLLMNEDGVLVDRTAELAPGFLTVQTDARDVLIHDLNEDDWPDVVVVNTFWQQPKFYRNLGLDAGGNWLGLADESATRFPHLVVANLPGPQFCAVGVGDVTGDQVPDLYFANYAMCCNGTTDVLLVNNGTGVFTDETTARLGTLANVAFGTAAEIHDMDNDGDNDIVKISTLYGVDSFLPGVYILFNDGTGNFANTQAVPSVSPYMMTVGHLDGDGMLDIVVEQDPQDQVDIATSVTPDGPNTYTEFTLVGSPRTAGFGGNTKLADVDNDGDLDLGISPIDVDIQNCGTATVFALLRNPGDGHFDDPWGSAQPQNFHVDPHDFGFIDINYDGCLDLFMGMCTGWKVFIQKNCAAPCTADVDGDGVVGILDFLDLLAAWGPNPGHPADLDGDGTVGILDFLELLSLWGPCL